MNIKTLIMSSVFATGTFSSSFASAATHALSGTYNLAADCTLLLSAERGTVKLPAGSIIVSENIPVSDGVPMSSAVHPAIIFQSGNLFEPVLSLGIGHVDEGFSFGPIPFSVGEYSSPTVFTENFVDSTKTTGTLEVSGDGVALSIQTLTPEQNACVLTRVSN